MQHFPSCTLQYSLPSNLLKCKSDVTSTLQCPFLALRIKAKPFTLTYKGLSDMAPACLSNLPFGSLSCGNILPLDEVKPILTLGPLHVPFFSLERSFLCFLLGGLFLSFFKSHLKCHLLRETFPSPTSSQVLTITLYHLVPSQQFFFLLYT